MNYGPKDYYNPLKKEHGKKVAGQLFKTQIKGFKKPRDMDNNQNIIAKAMDGGKNAKS